jgi:MFS family permease
MTATLERARPEPPADGRAAHERLGPRQRALVLAAMCMALVLVIAGVSSLAVALPDVATDLGLSQTTLTWVADSYAITLASLLLVAGAIGDRFGRRGALLVGIVLFGAGSLLSGLADSGGQLIAFRALTGIGGALIMPGTLSTITSVFPPEERARAVGIWAGFAGAGGTLGMLGAGWLLGANSWSSIFYVTTAMAALTFGAIVAFVPTTRATEHVGLDPLGTVLSALAIGSFVLGIIEGPMRGWTEPLTVTALVAGIALAVAFIRWELRLAAGPVHRPVRHLPGDPPVPPGAARLQRPQVGRGSAPPDARDDPALRRGRAAVGALRAQAGGRQRGGHHRGWAGGVRPARRR